MNPFLGLPPQQLAALCAAAGILLGLVGSWILAWFRRGPAETEAPAFPEALRTVSALVTGTSRDRIVESLLTVANRALGIRQAALFIPSRSGDTSIVLSSIGLDPSITDTLEIPAGAKSNINESIARRRPVARCDETATGPAFGLAVPVVVGDRLFGVLGIADPAALTWPKESKELLIGIVSLAELALAKITRLEASTLQGDEAQQTATFLRGVLGSYVSPGIADLIEARPELVNLKGEVREVTVLFADIMDFTTFCEFGEPTMLLRRLNEYLGVMADIILDHDGTIDKFLGDLIMAYWNAPLDQEHHARLALGAAMRMHVAQDELRDAWQKMGRQAMRMGLALNSGSVVFGHIGSQKKRDITILGEPVNLGARLEKLTREYQVPLVIGPRTRELLGPGFAIRKLGSTTVKGKEQTIEVYGLDDAEIRKNLEENS